jgi:hypothetical protein
MNSLLSSMLMLYEAATDPLPDPLILPTGETGDRFSIFAQWGGESWMPPPIQLFGLLENKVEENRSSGRRSLSDRSSGIRLGWRTRRPE